METAFSLLKNSLQLAAMAADAILDDLKLIPDMADDIIPPALLRVLEDGNEHLAQEGSLDLYGQACSKL